MIKRYPCGTVVRREFLASAAALPLLSTTVLGAQGPAQGKAAARFEKGLGVPGPYPGRVIEVKKPGLARKVEKGDKVEIARDRAGYRAALARGLCELTGAPAAVDAWRTFVEPGDVVGIKVVPNGFPMVPTSNELILEVIEGLKSAGIKTKDMVVFDRYKSEFMAAGIHKVLPDGVAWGGLTPEEGDGTQLKLKFDSKDPISGYDPDQFVQMDLVSKGHDPKDDRAYRSHLGLLVTKRVNKIICLPVLKDHGSAGVTGALKNMSHGLVNNVERSHSSPWANACNQYIPTVVKHPIIRQKCVLQIMDGGMGVWQGGPFGPNPKYAWEYNALFFATDPVALDHVEWEIIDAQRKAMGVPGVGAVGRLAADPFKTEGFDVRQPQHIALAGNLGLGIFDFKSPQGRRFSIDHKVVKA
jgi:hypothetical protein